MNGIIPHKYYDRKIKTRRYNEYLRDTLNPFNISDRCFINNYRLPKHLVIKLIDEIKPFLDDVDTNSRIPLHLEVLGTLNFYASGSHQRRVGLDAFAIMSQSKISASISRISKVIGSNLVKKYIKFPKILAEANIKKDQFFNQYGVPGIVGLIDCTHIALAKLKKQDEYAFVNRKNFHSINVQMISDLSMRIMNVNARYPGSTHDSHIWDGSIILPVIQQLNLEDSKTWLFDDSGYALKPYMMVPYRRPAINAQENFNQIHSKIRSGIERCFGVLKSRFRCLKRTSGHLHYAHPRAAQIIHACAMLHNLLININYPIEVIEDTSDEIVPISNADEDLNCGEFNREYLSHLMEENAIVI